jgi:hypothetical protein
MSNVISVDEVLAIDETADNVLDDSEYRFMNYTRHILLSARRILSLLAKSRILKKSKKVKQRPAASAAFPPRRHERDFERDFEFAGMYY